MTKTTSLTTRSGATAAPLPSDVATVPLRRLVLVELRKSLDTRAGRWLVAAIVAITAGVVTVFLFAADPADLTYENFVNATATPQSLLLPILGILTVTSEWGQRTGLVTFTLEPHRGRVAVAKLLAVLVLGALAVVAALLLAALGNVLGVALQDGSGSWAFGGSGVRDVFVVQLLGVLQGLALGMLIMNAAGAIVTYFAVPIVWGILTSFVDWFRRVGEWVDLNTTSMPLISHEISGDGWARLGVSTAIWVLLPLALGWLRLLRRELKSA